MRLPFQYRAIEEPASTLSSVHPRDFDFSGLLEIRTEDDAVAFLAAFLRNVLDYQDAVSEAERFEYGSDLNLLWVTDHVRSEMGYGSAGGRLTLEEEPWWPEARRIGALLMDAAEILAREGVLRMGPSHPFASTSGTGIYYSMTQRGKESLRSPEAE